jgi:hypothetical protein
VYCVPVLLMHVPKLVREDVDQRISTVAQHQLPPEHQLAFDSLPLEQFVTYQPFPFTPNHDGGVTNRGLRSSE